MKDIPLPHMARCPLTRQGCLQAECVGAVCVPQDKRGQSLDEYLAAISPPPQTCKVIGWIYEDGLDEDLPDWLYDKWFPFSRVLAGVRMFPVYAPLTKTPKRYRCDACWFPTDHIKPDGQTYPHKDEFGRPCQSKGIDQHPDKSENVTIAEDAHDPN